MAARSLQVKFIDLFAGLGGFHIALTRLGHTCEFACELDEHLQEIYEKNFSVRPKGDIRSIAATQVPEHDILCAGFPCQPFSKAGLQRGFNCPLFGDLFDNIIRILRHRKPQYFLLENVPHLAKHDGGQTWRDMEKRLKDLGYKVRCELLSPHQFGIPQIRERMFIVGSRAPLTDFEWPEKVGGAMPSIITALEENPADARKVSPQFERCLVTWQEFLDRFPSDQSLPSWPIWTMEFGADYPYEDVTPASLTERQLCQYRGSHGNVLGDLNPDERRSGLPSYARKERKFPAWKINFIRNNRKLYADNKAWIDKWLPKLLEFPASLQKFEWNCKDEKRNLWELMIQFRASGVRVKRPTSAPSLISMTTTQVPIVGWERRHLTARECASLQSLREIKNLPEIPSRAFAALGNAVNADLVELVAERLVGRVAPTITQECA